MQAHIGGSEGQRTWTAANGQELTMGEIMPDGAIVGEPGILIVSGVVYIREDNLSDALAAGWEQYSEAAPNGLVMVRRARPFKPRNP